MKGLNWRSALVDFFASIKGTGVICFTIACPRTLAAKYQRQQFRGPVRLH